MVPPPPPTPSSPPPQTPSPPAQTPTICCLQLICLSSESADGGYVMWFTKGLTKGSQNGLWEENSWIAMGLKCICIDGVSGSTCDVRGKWYKTNKIVGHIEEKCHCFKVITEPSYSNENLSFKWELQLSIHCHFCPCCLLYCCHPFLPSLLWVNKMEDQRRPQILKSGVQRGCRALSNRIRNHFWRKIRYFC